MKPHPDSGQRPSIDGPQKNALLKAATLSAKESSDDPDEATVDGIKAAKKEQRKCKTAGERADEHYDHFRLHVTGQLEWMQGRHHEQQERNKALEAQCKELSDVKAELAALRATRSFRKCVLNGSNLVAAIGGIAMAVFPVNADPTVLGMSSASGFGLGLSMLLIGTIITFSANFRD